MVHAETEKKVRLDAAGTGSKPQHFVYDFAIEATAEQGSVFSRIGVPIVQDAFHGYNSTVRASMVCRRGRKMYLSSYF